MRRQANIQEVCQLDFGGKEMCKRLLGKKVKKMWWYQSQIRGDKMQEDRGCTVRYHLFNEHAVRGDVMDFH